MSRVLDRYGEAMSDKPTPRFRKTKTDKWAVMAPVEDLEKALAEGGKIDVQKRSGDWSTFIVASLGKPFDVDGVQMCYGYGPEDEDEAETRSASATSPSDQGGRSRQTVSSRVPAGGQRSDRSPRSETRSSAAATAEPPPRDPSEPLPEYRGGPEDEWDGYF